MRNGLKEQLGIWNLKKKNVLRSGEYNLYNIERDIIYINVRNNKFKNDYKVCIYYVLQLLILLTVNK